MEDKDILKHIDRFNTMISDMGKQFKDMEWNHKLLVNENKALRHEVSELKNKIDALIPIVNELNIATGEY